ncbi:MAG: acyl carrier protein [Lachnospiraceae bacterium]|jgi:acyl carrier protein|nr:acyl carrier protein [Lachnospiraceae bacterium]MBQ3902239.1 acyl carrier protein [Lachnospiraceae bacterium]MCR5210977.1 acyl carrier protein [Lachnospiraceae bacterium]
MDDLLSILNGLHPEVDYETEDGLIDSGILDSFDIVTLVTEIQDTFDVTLDASDIVPENFNSAEAIYSLIEKKQEEDA